MMFSIVINTYSCNTGATLASLIHRWNRPGARAVCARAAEPSRLAAPPEVAYIVAARWQPWVWERSWIRFCDPWSLMMTMTLAISRFYKKVILIN